MRFVKVLPVAALITLGAGAANADVSFANSVAYWNQQGQSGSQASTLGTGSAHVSIVEAMNRGAGLVANAGTNSLNSKDWTGQVTDYVEFGFTVDAGYAATLDKLYLATKVSATGPTQASIFTSLDGYSAAIGTIAQDNAGGTFANAAIDLSALGPITGTLNFRIFGSGASSANGTMRIGDYFNAGTYYYDSITGSVAAVPEPESYAMLLAGLGLMGFIARRRGK